MAIRDLCRRLKRLEAARQRAGIRLVVVVDEAHAERVERTGQFAPALDRAIASVRPALIELVTDPEQISTRLKISEVRDTALAKKNEESV